MSEVNTNTTNQGEERLIGNISNTLGTYEVFIDDVSYGIFSSYSSAAVTSHAIIIFEKLNMQLGYHTVRMVTKTISTDSNASQKVGFLLDAVDIDDIGYISENHKLLRITMSDSSEREYKLSSADAFITWYNRTVATCNIGNTCYEFTDSVDGSTEYLAFDKIISFEVIPVA